ncbi:alpha/beta fold hydrolase [Actinokineospora sp. G85]|uniref:alpha/beta fold hydrolase n=1 Tax=Actinokineospora sp. G85 TaxID=3406626 RepID=UPI003C749D3A
MATAPQWVASATANVSAKLFRGGLADLRPTPRALVDKGRTRSVYRFTPRGGGDPVLLVPPLAAPAFCFDLRRGCSLAGHLVERGRSVYLVDYGQVSFADRNLGLEHWVDDVLPRAVAAASRDAGGRPVHVVAWCLGGIMSLLVAADRQDLPIASLTTIAAPIDMSAIPLVAPIKPLTDIADSWLFTPAYRLLGGAPRALVKRAFQISAIDKVITKPYAVLRNLDDADYLAQLEAVDRFTDNMAAYPGRTFGQIYHRFFRANDLAHGELELGGRRIALRQVTVPTLVIAGDGDTIAPHRAVRHVVDILDRAPEVEFHTCPGGHLGVLAGRAARTTTWRHIDRFLDRHNPVR